MLKCANVYHKYTKKIKIFNNECSYFISNKYTTCIFTFYIQLYLILYKFLLHYNKQKKKKAKKN